MTQVVAVEKTPEALALEVEQEEAQALKDFNEGFTDTPVEPTEEEKVAQAAAQAEADRVAAEETAKEEARKLAEAPIAKSDPVFLDLVKKANSIEEIRQLAEKVRDHTNGRVGSLEQTIKKLQEATPIGQAIVATPEDFVEIGKDMPEHAKMLADGLTRVLSKIKGTGTPTPLETPEQFEERVNKTVDQREEAREKARLKVIQDEARADLAEVHADWETVVGAEGSQTEFRKYLDTQPKLFKKRALTTNDPYVLAEAITQFKTFQEEAKKPKPKVVSTARQDRLREAVPLRGGATPPNTNKIKTPDEEFAEGFNS